MIDILLFNSAAEKEEAYIRYRLFIHTVLPLKLNIITLSPDDQRMKT